MQIRRPNGATWFAAAFLMLGCSTTAETIPTQPEAESEANGPSAPEPASESPPPKPGPGRGPVQADTHVELGNLFARTGLATVATDKSTYTFGESISITFEGMAGNAHDWISLAPAGESALYYSWWRYTSSAVSGTIATPAGDGLPPGTYVARAYFNDGYAIEAESATFTVTGSVGTLPATVSTDKASYGGLETVQISYAGLAGTSTDWLGVYLPKASSSSGVAAWTYTTGASTGTVGVWPLYSGTWEIRAFNTDSMVLAGRSSAITVTPAVATDKSSYAASEQVVVTFGGMAGYYATDSVAIAVAGSPSAEFVSSQTANWEAGGTRSFTVSALASGTYVARAFFQGTAAAQAESATFTLTQ